MLSEAPPRITAVLLGLPLAAATVLLLRPWIEHGRLPRFLPALGVVVLLVDLLASGGIGFPGVAWNLVVVAGLGTSGRTAAGVAHPGGLGAALRRVGPAPGLLHYGVQPGIGLPGRVTQGRAATGLGGRAPGGCRRCRPLGGRAVAAVGRRHVCTLVAATQRRNISPFRGSHGQDVGASPQFGPAWLAAGDWSFGRRRRRARAAEVPPKGP